MSKIQTKFYYHYNLNSLSEKDFILASFPKSGSTWIRFIIGNIYNQLAPQFDEINFHTVNDLIPSLERPAKGQMKQLPRVFKTHEQCKNKFHNTILVVRHPFDALFSFYKYLNGERKISISLSETIHHPTYGIREIVAHTNSYTDSCPNLLTVTYESLHQSPFQKVKEACEFLGLSVDDEIIHHAIEQSSFNTMRKIEKDKGRRFGSKDFTFTRSGKVGEGEESISEEDKSYILQEIQNSDLLARTYGNK